MAEKFRMHFINKPRDSGFDAEIQKKNIITAHPNKKKKLNLSKPSELLQSNIHFRWWPPYIAVDERKTWGSGDPLRESFGKRLET